MKDFNPTKIQAKEQKGFTPDEHNMIRKRYLKNLKMRFSEMKENSIIVFEGGKKMPRYDIDVDYYYFEQESNFLYLTGVTLPNMRAVIDARDESCTLFYQPEPEESRAFKPILTLEEIKVIYKVEVKLMSELNTFIQKRNMEAIYLMDGLHPSSDYPVHTAELDFKGELSYLNQRVSHNKYIYMVLCEMRLLKVECEKKILREVAKMSCEAIKQLMKAMAPGLNERDMENVYLQYLRSTYYLRSYGFNCICASGKDSATLHYEHNNKTMNENDLFLADLGARYCLYVSDTSITIPVSGKFSDLQKGIYDIVLEAKNKALAAVKCGTSTMSDLSQVAYEVIIKGLQALKILKEDVDAKILMTMGMGRVFMPHSLGHMLGLDCHDVGNNVSYRSLGILDDGMCVTIEPGIYFIDNLLDQTLLDPMKAKYINVEELKKYRGFGGVRIEDTILIDKKTEYENLMVGLPRTTTEIENFMKK